MGSSQSKRDKKKASLQMAAAAGRHHHHFDTDSFPAPLRRHRGRPEHPQQHQHQQELLPSYPSHQYLSYQDLYAGPYDDEPFLRPPLYLPPPARHLPIDEPTYASAQSLHQLAPRRRRAKPAAAAAAARLGRLPEPAPPLQLAEALDDDYGPLEYGPPYAELDEYEELGGGGGGGAGTGVRPAAPGGRLARRVAGTRPAPESRRGRAQLGKAPVSVSRRRRQHEASGRPEPTTAEGAKLAGVGGHGRGAAAAATRQQQPLGTGVGSLASSSASSSQYSSHSSNSHSNSTLAAAQPQPQQPPRPSHQDHRRRGLYQDDSVDELVNTRSRQQAAETMTSQAVNKATVASHEEKGLGFSEDERRQRGLLGLLPHAHQDQELQVQGVLHFLDECAPDELSKYVYLRHLKDFNERLFYLALQRNVEKLMPIVYTPTVGLGCQKFSHLYLRPRGLWIRSRDAGQVRQLVANWPEEEVRVIVVTDGERILGLGDLGANGMGISIGKLSLYTALAGIPPRNTLPVTIDVGTTNQANLEDPLYIGLREARLRGEPYQRLVDEFMEAVAQRWGRTCLVQFEDFANATAFGLLQRHRDRYCTFNDDIQGTASVCLAGLISASRLIGRRLADCTFLFYGAGEANLGTANLLVMAMCEEGASEAEAKARIWLVDSRGLVVSSRQDLSGHKRQYAQPGPELANLAEIVDQVRPAAIVGASAQGGAFNREVLAKMASANERPIVFALSNPTSKAECTAQQAYDYTEGRCVFASGSPFEPVSHQGKSYVTGQGNNAYIFPAVGLAAIAAQVHTIPEETFLVSARALSDQLLPQEAQQGLVYPSLTKIREVTLKVACRVLEFFYAERLATYRPEPDDKLQFLKGIQYDPRY